MRCFNPHTHEGCDLMLLFLFKSLKSFNPHTHEGCDGLSARKTLALRSFNPHTHEGCDFMLGKMPIGKAVSIHTPTKGVTPYKHLLELNIQQFQSTHPRRVWLDLLAFPIMTALFQSTHPRRVWLNSQRYCVCIPIVSIHTPTKGVTPYSK